MGRGTRTAILLAVILAALPGCWVVAAGAAGTGVAWHLGAMETLVDGSPQQIISAAERSLEESGFTVLSVDDHETQAELVGRTNTDQKIHIVVKRLTRLTSELSIRIGVFGDENLSLALFNGILEQLDSPKG